MRKSGQRLCLFDLSYTAMWKLQSHFLFRSNETKYDLACLEAFLYQSYYGLLRHMRSPPVIGVLSFEFF